MKKHTLILILIALISCEEDPTYNPFDDQFNVSVNQLVRDKCDTISAGCGYFNLTKNSGRFRPYYQIYANDWHKVVAKGFEYRIDSFKVKEIDNFYLIRNQMDSVVNLPFDRKMMNLELEKFGYQIISRDSSMLTIANEETKDTITRRIKIFPTKYNSYIVRGFAYFKSTSTNH